MSTTFKNPSEAFAHRLRVIRNQQGLSTQALADRLTEMGFPMQRNAITKIETQNGRTTVTLEEAIAFAEALHTPLAVMLAPVDVPGAKVHTVPKKKPMAAWRYIDHLMTGRWSGNIGWPDGERVAELYLELVTQQKALRDCMRRVQEAEYIDDETAAKRAKRDAVAAFRTLERSILELEKRGLADTANLMPPDAIELAKKLGAV